MISLYLVLSLVNHCHSNCGSNFSTINQIILRLKPFSGFQLHIKYNLNSSQWSGLPTYLVPLQPLQIPTYLPPHSLTFMCPVNKSLPDASGILPLNTSNWLETKGLWILTEYCAWRVLLSSWSSLFHHSCLSSANTSTNFWILTGLSLLIHYPVNCI